MFALLLAISPCLAATPGPHIRGVTHVEVPVPHPEVAIVMAKQHLTPHVELTLEASFLPAIVESGGQKPF